MKMTSSEVRTNLNKCLPKIYKGDDIHIAVNDVVVAVLSKAPLDEDLPILQIQVTKAKTRWSELLSAISTIGAQFVFVNNKDVTKRVYLYRAPEYRNDFAEKWFLNLSHTVSESLNDRKSERNAKEMVATLIRLMHRSNMLHMTPEMVRELRLNANDIERYEVD